MLVTTVSRAKTDEPIKTLFVTFSKCSTFNDTPLTNGVE